MPDTKATGGLKRMQVWSSGGGTQSAAIAALICRGDLRPDVAVIVDTEREVSTTWEYHDKVIVPALAKVGVNLHRIPKSKYATVDLYSAKGHKILIPAFTTASGKVGKLPTYCSNEWKARVVRRFVSEIFPKEKGFDIWLGISRDEAHRMKRGEGRWQYKHPLIDDNRLMSRRDCVALVRDMGWPDPPRSRCWMCPNQGKYEWEELRKNTPGEFLKAKELEKEINKEDKHLYLSSSGVPLGNANHAIDNQGGDCMSGMCFV